MEKIETEEILIDTSFPGAARASFTLKGVAGLQACWATHPMQTNFDRNARGRALHYRRPGQKLTLCNMRFAFSAEKHTKDNGTCSGKVCKVCVAKASKALSQRQKGGSEA